MLDTVETVSVTNEGKFGEEQKNAKQPPEEEAMSWTDTCDSDNDDQVGKGSGHGNRKKWGKRSEYSLKRREAASFKYNSNTRYATQTGIKI